MTRPMALRLDHTPAPPTAEEGTPPVPQGGAAVPGTESAADRREAGYRARRATIQAHLAAATTASARELPGLYLAIAREGLEGLAVEPREPVLLNYTGVGLNELGAREGAAQLFEAALRLDP